MNRPTIKVKVRFRTCRKDGKAIPKPAGPTPIARRIALAHHIETLIERGELRDYADAARRLGLSRARMTQIADLALLAPDIQTAVLLGHVEPSSHHLREIGRHRLWDDQKRIYQQVLNFTDEE